MKTLERRWNDIAVLLAVKGHEPDSEQYRSLKAVYFYGALGMFEIIKDAGGLGTIEEQMNYAESVGREIGEYFDFIRKEKKL